MNVQFVTPADDLEKKKALMSALEDEVVFRGSFVRRSKTKSGHTRYYLYTEDMNDLIIASQVNQRSNKVRAYISIDANEFEERECDTYIGKCENPHLSPKFFLEYYDKLTKKYKDVMQVRYLRYYEKEKGDDNRKVKLRVMPRDKSTPEIADQADFATLFPQKFPEIKYTESVSNLYFEKDGKFVFALAKLFDDEFFISISNPLSVVEGFSIAISTFYSVHNEFRG